MGKTKTNSRRSLARKELSNAEFQILQIVSRIRNFKIVRSRTVVRRGFHVVMKIFWY